MTSPELRAEPRVRVSCRGTMRVGETSAECLIENMCSRGFLIRFTSALPVGRVVDLSADLDPEGTIECKVQVRHVNASCLGARVIEITEEGQQRCRRFLAARSGRDNAAFGPAT